MGKKSKSHCCKCYSHRKHSCVHCAGKEAVLSCTGWTYDPYKPIYINKCTSERKNYSSLPQQTRILAPPNHNVYPYFPPALMDMGFSTAQYNTPEEAHVLNREVDGTRRVYYDRYDFNPSTPLVRRYDESGREIFFN
ncbi:expressed protein [Echinococcus multilocularis]|uniref:Expressed protein n=1 Tax=Echinococcus multilocularis TaxID=6211 RepID=A0A068Y9Q6_ECHMU|nr:expressed protein [Echinococcus multilocularis]